jgi:hypothetical protein
MQRRPDQRLFVSVEMLNLGATIYSHTDTSAASCRAARCVAWAPPETLVLDFMRTGGSFFLLDELVCAVFPAESD